MNKNKLIVIYKEKIKLLNTYNENYYNLSKPIVTDYKYDQLKKEILLLEDEYNFLESKNSPSKIVGFRPSKTFNKVFHKVPMLSLTNGFTREDLINFEKRILNYLSKNNDFILCYSAEPKIDGISASLIYKNSQFKVGL